MTAAGDYTIDTIRHPSGKMIYWGNEGGAEIIYTQPERYGPKIIHYMGTHDQVAARWAQLKQRLGTEVAEEASPMIKPPTNRFDTKREAFEYQRQHGGRVFRRRYTDPNTGMVSTSYVVKPEESAVQQDVREGLSWKSLDAGLSLDNKIAIFEEYYTKGNLFESIDEDKKSYFVSLFDMSSVPEKNKRYIVVPLSLMGDRILPLDKPSYLEYLGKSNGQLVFRSNRGEIRYPSKTMRDLSVFNTFTFSSSDTYDKFRTALTLKFDTNLPDVILSKKGLAEGNYEETEETAVINMFEKLVKQGRDPLDMIAHRFGWGSYELDQLAQNLGFKNSAEWARGVEQGKGVNTEGVTEDVDVDAIHAQALREHLLTNPELYENRQDVIEMREFLKLHATPRPRVGKEYVYASVQVTPLANFVHVAHFNNERPLVSLEDRAYFEIDENIKRFPVSGSLSGDALSEIYFFNSSKEFQDFNALLSLKYSDYKITYKILDQQAVREDTESSILKKIETKRNSLSLAREQRRARGHHQQGQREMRLQAEIDRLSNELTQLKKKAVAEGAFDHMSEEDLKNHIDDLRARANALKQKAKTSKKARDEYYELVSQHHQASQKLYGLDEEGVAEGNDQQIKVGSKVYHDLYGSGQVTKMSTGAGSDHWAEVKFVNGTTRRVNRKRINLEREQGVSEGSKVKTAKGYGDVVQGTDVKTVAKADLGKNKLNLPKGYGDVVQPEKLKTVAKAKGVSEGSQEPANLNELSVMPSDEYRVEVEDGQAHLIDGEGTVRVSMPVGIWQQIAGRKGRADEYRVEVEDGQVHLLDGEGTVRVSMPTSVWRGLKEEKIKGVDGRACWPGHRYAGRVKKADGTYKDRCVPVSNESAAAPDTKEIAMEDQYQSVKSAIAHRIMRQRLDLLKQYGPEMVDTAIEEIAQGVGSVDEIGSSDVSGWVRQVADLLHHMDSTADPHDTDNPAPMEEGVQEGRFGDPLTGWHIVSRAHGQVVRSFETQEQAQKYLMTKMFANHHDFKIVHTAGVAEGPDKLRGTPVVSLSDFGDKDYKKDKYGRTVPKKIKKDDPRVKFYKEPKKPGVQEVTKHDTNASAYDEGYSARMNGKPVRLNPYPRQLTIEHNDWLTGWDDANMFALQQGWGEAEGTKQHNTNEGKQMKTTQQINEYQTLAGWQAAARRSGAELVSEGTRAVRAGILVGRWDGTQGQLMEGVEDRIEAAREKAAKKGLIKGGPEQEQPKVRRVAGAAYGGSKAQEEPTDDGDDDDTPPKGGRPVTRDEPKKRGRPAGSGKKAAPAAEPKKRGRPAKAPAAAAAAPKKRGRPRRVMEGYDGVEDRIVLDGQEVDLDSIQAEYLSGDEATIVAAAYMDGTSLSDRELDALERQYPTLAYEFASEQRVPELDRMTEQSVSENAVQERQLSSAERAKKERFVRGMKKAQGDFEERYGERGEEVMHATATKMAKKKVAESRAARPDYLDLDKDGDRAEPMKKAAADAKKDKTDESIDHIRQLAGLGNTHRSGADMMKPYPVQEAAKPDYLDLDGDGNRAEPMKKAAADAKKDKKEKVDENVNMSISADGEEDVSMMIRKLAGIPAVMVATSEPAPATGCGLADAMQGIAEEYDNSPEETVYDVNTQLKQGGDLNRAKSQHANMPKAGDNPLATHPTMESLLKKYQDILGAGDETSQ